jgi:hypothetical protein
MWAEMSVGQYLSLIIVCAMKQLNMYADFLKVMGIYLNFSQNINIISYFSSIILK